MVFVVFVVLLLVGDFGDVIGVIDVIDFLEVGDLLYELLVFNGYFNGDVLLCFGLGCFNKFFSIEVKVVGKCWFC